MHRLIALYRWFVHLGERFTKTDVAYLASGGFWLVAGQVGAAVIAFVLSLVVARYVPANIYGSYKYILAVSAIIGAFSLSGLGTTVTRAVARGKEGVLRASFRTALITSIPMFLGFVGVSAYYFLKADQTLGTAMLVAGIATLTLNASTLFISFWNGKKMFARYTLLWTIGNVFTTACTIGAMLWSDNVVVLISTYFVSSALINFALYLYTARTATAVMPETTHTKDALHLSVINFLNTISANIDKIIIFQLLGTVQLAIYTFALAMPEQARAVLKSGARLALPRFAERSLSDIKETLSGKMFRFGVLIAGIAVIYIVIAPTLFHILFPAYAESIPYSQLAILTLFGALGTAPLTALQAHLQHRALYTHAIVTNVVQILSSVILISLWGLWGAIASLLFNRAIALLLPLFLLGQTSDSGSVAPTDQTVH